MPRAPGAGSAAAVAGASGGATTALAYLTDQRVGLVEQARSLLARVRDDGVGIMSSLVRPILVAQAIDEASELARPSVQQEGDAPAHLASFVGGEQQPDDEARRASDEEALGEESSGAMSAWHGSRGRGAREDTSGRRVRRRGQTAKAAPPGERGLTACVGARRRAETGAAGRYRFFFLWRFLRSRFLRLWVAILWRLRFLPQGMGRRGVGQEVRADAQDSPPGAGAGEERGKEFGVSSGQ